MNTPTARGGQTLVRLKMRNLLTNAVFERTFKASDKFKEPDLQSVQASYLYSDGDGSHFLDQESYETVTLNRQMVGDALDLLVEGALIELHRFNGSSGDGPGNPRPPLYQRGRKGESVHREPGVCGESLSRLRIDGNNIAAAFNASGQNVLSPVLDSHRSLRGWSAQEGNDFLNRLQAIMA